MSSRLNWYDPKHEGYETEWNDFAGSGVQVDIIRDINERLLALEKDAELRKKHPALQEMHEKYETMKVLLTNE